MLPGLGSRLGGKRRASFGLWVTLGKGEGIRGGSLDAVLWEFSVKMTCCFREGLRWDYSAKLVL